MRMKNYKKNQNDINICLKSEWILHPNIYITQVDNKLKFERIDKQFENICSLK